MAADLANGDARAVSSPDDPATLPREPHERLQWARRNAGYVTATDAAVAMGAGITSYISHENGHRRFRNVAEHYAKHFRISLAWLLVGEGHPRARTLGQEIDLETPEIQAQMQTFYEWLKFRAGKSPTT